MTTKDRQRESMVPLSELSSETQAEDSPSALSLIAKQSDEITTLHRDQETALH